MDQKSADHRIDAFMDRSRRVSSEYHFLSKLYNKLLHRPTNDVVNFRGRGWVECACIRWERSRKRTHHESCRGGFELESRQGLGLGLVPGTGYIRISNPNPVDRSIKFS